jgi:hypothetical protein
MFVLIVAASSQSEVAAEDWVMMRKTAISVAIWSADTKSISFYRA